MDPVAQDPHGVRGDQGDPGEPLDGAGAPGASGRSYFLRRLTFLVLIVAVPFAVQEALSLWRAVSQARTAALVTLSEHSQESAKTVDDVLRRAEQLLSFLASRGELKKLNGIDCQGLLTGATDIDPVYANVMLLRADGATVCSAVPQQAFALASSPAWFTRALASEGFDLSPPMMGSGPDGRHVALLSLPVLAPSGDKLGLLAVAIDLQALAQSLPFASLPEGTSVSVVMGDGRFLTRYPDPQAWIGQPIAQAVREQRARSPTGVIEARGVDGVERAFAAKPSRHGLRVSVGMPTAPLYAEARGDLVFDAAVAAGVIIWGLLAAYVGARRLARPLQSISEVARRLAAGARDVRADESLPGEFGELSVEFNRLMAQQDVAAASLRRSEAHARRISYFYEALSSTNQAIARMPQPEALFAEVCRICVATRLADMAWIGIVDKEVLRPVAWGGRAREYTEGLLIAVNDGAQQGPTARAVRTGLPVTANHYLHDASTQAWRERAAHFNVQASAAFPFSCDGRAVGALNLYSSVEGYFDAEMVTLLQSMTHDISMALDAARRQEQQSAQIEAEAANRARSAFLSKVSHELRTPLNAILGFSQLLQLRARDGLARESQEHLDHIYLAATQLRALIDDVMDLSRLQAGQLALNHKDVQLDRLLDGVLNLCKPQAEKAGVHLVSDLSAVRDLHIHTDPVRLRQMVLNLLTNAIKYNKPEGHVRLSLAVTGGTLCITVSDSGIGMSPSQLATLFEPFNRLGREASAIEGTGIGMNLTQQLVNLFGGSMTVQSEVDVGTQVEIRLPLVQAAPGGDDAAARVAEAVAAPAAGGPRGLLLYIEDNPVNAILVQQLLAGWPDVEVVVAPTGGEGLVQARQLRPDLVLLDMNLPDMGGVDVLRKLRSEDATRGLRVIALSAATLQDDIDAAKAAGADAYWTKPIDFVQVLQGVEAALSGRVPGAQTQGQATPSVLMKAV